MKNKKLIYGLIAFVALFVVTAWVNGIQARNDLSMVLKAKAEKEEYVLGEVVRMNFQLVNDGERAVSLLHRPDVSTGYMKLWVSYEGGEFALYNNGTWGRLEGGSITLQPGQSFDSEASIFWNNKMPTSHLNAEAAKRTAKGKITTDYAFSAAGTYYVKAVVDLPENLADEKLKKVESEPVKIVINQPVAEDLKVWNSIKDDGDIAFFIQQGNTRTFQDTKTAQLIEKVERIVQENPNSALADRLKQNLEKFRAENTKRIEALEKGRIKPKN